MADLTRNEKPVGNAVHHISNFSHFFFPKTNLLKSVLQVIFQTMVNLSLNSEVCKIGISLIDNTSLNLDDTNASIDALVAGSTAEEPHTAAICIYPKFVKYAKETYPHMRVATVVNFPGGQDSEADVVALTKLAVADGADEVDMVIDYKRIIVNETEGIEAAKAIVSAVRAACPEGRVLLKVIIESGELKTPRLIAAASNAAIECGADFIKTSTGKVPINATIESATVMLNCIKDFHAAHPYSKRVIGFKPAGGVKTVEQTREFLQLAESICGEGWLSQRTFRFGASSLLKVLRGALVDKTVTASGY